MAKLPEMTPVKSTMLDGYHYDGDSRVLTVQFRNGGAYAYADVPAEKVSTMAESASPGGYFAARIKGLHEAKKL